ncbi:hypothetical protein [Aureimonas pseudogalii]|uniref:Uncharacterized protein n=1 Tax=Aureimonas pseudogalii TaxID=1744844 RepID=A0A7W6E9I7_9HYPH|nr:hypothetical protein [Aureimonas pseudogalii]MBB3997208.1 hypothetical protein [Aureimonas pseudogalii]
MSDKMSDKPKTAMTIFAAPEGGFYVGEQAMSNYEISTYVAAFSTLQEALHFVSRKMTPSFELTEGQDLLQSGNVLRGRYV